MRTGAGTSTASYQSLEEYWDPEVVFPSPPACCRNPQPSTVRTGFCGFTAEQMKAFRDRSVWLEPLEYIDAGDRLVVPYRFGGVARHTGIEVELSFVHVFTIRDGKTVRVDVYETKAEALEAAGLPK